MAANIFWELPPVTRTYLACCLATTVLCGLDVLSPFHLYYNWLAIVSRGQTWRLFTTFCYFGNTIQCYHFLLEFCLCRLNSICIFCHFTYF